jgi:hypothetical protein
MLKSRLAWVAAAFLGLAGLASPYAPASAAPQRSAMLQGPELSAGAPLGVAAEADCRRRYWRYWRYRRAPYYVYRPYYRSWSSPSDYMANELNRQQLFGLGRSPYPYGPYSPY